jgi:3-dehydroquinate synthase
LPVKTIEINFERKYPCKSILGRGILAEIKKYLIPLLPEPGVVILTNSLLKRLYGNRLISDLTKHGITVHTIVIGDGEKVKNITTANKIFGKLLNWKTNRYTTLITLGGGVIGDLGGFVAATFMRGIPLIHIPTTLLAQIDSSIGGKVAINHPKAKNTIGSFYQPAAILIDFEVLQSLPVRQIKNGLVEAIKIAIISRPPFFYWLKDNIERIVQKEHEVLDMLVNRAVQEKIDIVLRDPWEKNERQFLNLGHTIGHVWETIDNYNGITHGEAVALGILVEAKIAYHRGICSEECQEDIKQIFSLLFNSFPSSFGPFFPTLFQYKQDAKSTENQNIDFEQFWDILTLDKKNKKGEIVFVLPEKLGRVCSVNNISKEEVIKSLQDFIADNKKERQVC